MRYILPIFLLFAAIAGFAAYSDYGRGTEAVAPIRTATTSQPAGAAVSQTASTTVAATPVATSSSLAATSAQAVSTPKKQEYKPKNTPVSPPPPPVQVARAESPYTTPGESLEKIDAITRAALVNILCMPQNGTLRPISGSGVIIDPSGVILTNAHVAQYVLLSQTPQINLICSIRTGSPAQFKWKAVVLYIPTVWVNAHYQEINTRGAAGTGEHDYALLQIVSDTQGNPVTEPLPYLDLETRPNVAFEGDPILAAGYAAEFVGGIAAQQNLYAQTSITSIKQLLTFTKVPVDVFSLGSIITAQGGSSGGAVVNPWRRLVGIITTTSEGATTAERDLHALSLNYIDRDITEQTSKNLEAILASDTLRLASEFSRETAPALIQKYIDYLSR